MLRSSKTSLVACVMAGGLLCLPAFSLAKEQAAALLEKMLQAEHTQGLSGLFVYSHGQGLKTMQIDRTYVAGRWAERLVSSDGQVMDQRADRHARYHVNPRDKNILVLPLEPSQTASAKEEAAHSLASVYELATGELERVAGQYCRQLSVLPKDRWRYGALYCVEEHTGVMLRSSTVSSEGDILEQMVFTRISMGDPGAMTPTLEELDAVGFRRTPAIKQVEHPEWLGDWSMLSLPPGFQIQLEEIRQDSLTQTPYLHVTLHDGLAGVSVFLVKNKTPGQGSEHVSGALSVLQHPVGENTLTLIGEVPLRTLQQIAAGFHVQPIGVP